MKFSILYFLQCPISHRKSTADTFYRYTKVNEVDKALLSAELEPVESGEPGHRREERTEAPAVVWQFADLNVASRFHAEEVKAAIEVTGNGPELPERTPRPLWIQMNFSL